MIKIYVNRYRIMGRPKKKKDGDNEEEAGRTTAKIPDIVIKTIDEEMVGDFASRGEFVNYALKNFTIHLKNKSNDIRIKLHKTCKNDIVVSEMTNKRMLRYIEELKEEAELYDSKESTQVTAHTTKKQFSYIDLIYVGKDKPFRFLKDYVKVAVIWYLNVMEAEMQLPTIINLCDQQ